MLFRSTLTDEDGFTGTAQAALPHEAAQDTAKAEASVREQLGRFGASIFAVHDIALQLSQPWFVPASSLNALRREAIEALGEARDAIRPRGGRKPVSVPPPVYPESHLSFLANVYNEKARAFYHRYGVQLIDAAYEAHEETGEVPVMITKHCLRFSFNLCPKQAKGVTGVRTKVAPMQLVHGDEVLTLKFDCKPCEMHVVGKMKGHILDLPLPGSASSVVGQISPDDLMKTIRRSPQA